MFFTIYSYRDANKFACTDTNNSTNNRRFCKAFLEMTARYTYFANESTYFVHEKIDILSFDK